MDTHLEPVLGIPPFAQCGTYSPHNKFMWDAWFIKHDDTWHMFYLQSDLCDDPEERHHLSSIGHASTKDLQHWTEHDTALKASIDDDWDDLALWTGCVMKHYDGWYMYYTGRSKDDFWGQKIGIAFSKDLYTWIKFDNNPVTEPELPYCDSGSASNFGNIPAWRDPTVWYDIPDKEYKMLFSARMENAKDNFNGAIGLATSKDSLKWQVQKKPILAPHRYNEMETSQVIVHKGIYYLFFSTWAASYNPSWKQEVGAHSGLHCYSSNSLTGNFTPVNENGVVMDNGKELYVVKILEHIEGTDEYIALGWLNYDQDNKFIGKISAPFILKIANGTVTFDRFQ